jgi:hypothetical protein
MHSQLIVHYVVKMCVLSRRLQVYDLPTRHECISTTSHWFRYFVFTNRSKADVHTQKHEFKRDALSVFKHPFSRCLEQVIFIFIRYVRTSYYSSNLWHMNKTSDVGGSTMNIGIYSCYSRIIKARTFYLVVLYILPNGIIQCDFIGITETSQ